MPSRSLAIPEFSIPDYSAPEFSTPALPTATSISYPITKSLGEFQGIGRGRAKVVVDGTTTHVRDIDLFRASSFDDVASKLTAALAYAGVIVDVTYANNALSFSGVGFTSIGPSTTRANEAQHVWGYINMGDGYDDVYHPHGMRPETWTTGSWSSLTGEALRLLGLGMVNVYGYTPWGFENPVGPGYQTGYLAAGYGSGALFCYESGARIVEGINNLPVASFVSSWSPVVSAFKSAGGNIVFEPGAPPVGDATNWEKEVLDSGADIGFATGGGVDPGTTPAPACVAYYANVIASGAKIYLEPGERTDFIEYAPWQDGTYGTIHNLNRAVLIVGGDGFFRAHPWQHKNLLLTFVDEFGHDLTIDQQLDIAPLWIRRGFECMVGATWGMTAAQVFRGIAISGDTDLFSEGFIHDNSSAAVAVLTSPIRELLLN